MDSWDSIDGEDDTAPGLPEHQLIFDELLDLYNDGIEPLENWTSSDLVRLSAVANAELQSRQPPAGSWYDIGYENEPDGAE